MTAAGIVVPLVIAGVAGAAPGRREDDDRDGPIEYRIHPAGRWGPRWRDTVPPGRPRDARPTSEEGAAYPYIEAIGRPLTDDSEFVPLMLQLAAKESRGCFALPANNYDARPPADRAGGPLITAEGVWQYQRALWRRPDHMRDIGIPAPVGFDDLPEDIEPWEVTARQEVELPLLFYARMYNFARTHGATISQAGQMVHTWQHGSGWGKAALARGRETRRWDEAFAAIVPSDNRDTINRHLRTAGVIA